MNNNDSSGGGNRGEGVPLLRPEDFSSLSQQQPSPQQQQQQQQQHDVMAQYGNNMAAYAMAAAQHEAAAAAAAGGGDYGYGAMSGTGGGPMPPNQGSPYGYFPGPYMYSGQPGAPQPPQAYYGGPPGGPGGMSPQQSMQYYAPYGAPPPPNQGAPPPPPPNPAPSSRPPRATRRGKSSPSPTNQLRKKQQDDQYMTQQQGGMHLSSFSDVVDDHQQGPSSIPPLKDIFSVGDPTTQALLTGSGMDAHGYGSTAGGSKIWNSPKPPDGGKIWNSPAPRYPKDNSSGGGRSPRVQHVLVRTSSSEDMQGNRQGGGGASNSSNNNNNNNASKKSRGHRRSSSDTPLRVMRQHRRLGSTDAILPPISNKRSSLSANNSFSGEAGNRNRSFSAGGGGPVVGGGGGGRPRHRRTDSMASSVNTGYTSNASVGSVVSNIAKSAMFGGVTDKGEVQMHKPFERIRLVMMSPTKGPQFYDYGGPTNRIVSSLTGEEEDMEVGKFYLESNLTDPDKFNDYHRVTTDIAQGMQPNWESLEREELICTCPCNNCNGCTGKAQLLPSANYVLAVNDDVYRRVLSEIANARTMPCGLFFCGHHEDVSHPSILIAVSLVALLFAAMAVVAFYMPDTYS